MVWLGDEILINSQNGVNLSWLQLEGWHPAGLVSKQNTGRHGFSLIAASKLAIKGHISTASSHEISPILHWNIFHQFLAIFCWFALQQKKGTTAHWFLSYLMLPGSTELPETLGDVFSAATNAASWPDLLQNLRIHGTGYIYPGIPLVSFWVSACFHGANC